MPSLFSASVGVWSILQFVSALAGLVGCVKLGELPLMMTVVLGVRSTVVQDGSL